MAGTAAGTDVRLLAIAIVAVTVSASTVMLWPVAPPAHRSPVAWDRIAEEFEGILTATVVDIVRDRPVLAAPGGASGQMLDGLTETARTRAEPRLSARFGTGGTPGPGEFRLDAWNLTLRSSWWTSPVDGTAIPGDATLVAWGTFRAGGSRPETRNISVDRPLGMPIPYIVALGARFSAGFDSDLGPVATTVAGILTAIVRIRAAAGLANGAWETPRDLIQEGDVERAVNLAILLEERRVLGGSGPGAPAAFDDSLLDATAARWDPATGRSPDNPTGRRPWGTAEQNEYARYLARLPPDRDSRRAATVIAGIPEEATSLDPVDVAALVLALDRVRPDAGIRADPTDDRSILKEAGLVDPRQPSRDVDPEGLIGTAWSPWGSPGTASPVVVEQSPAYLVVGDDLTVQGIYPPALWMTNVVLTQGRTGGVPPPQPPPAHDHRLRWELGISGAMGLNLSSRSPAGTITVARSISFSFTVPILAWLPAPPANPAVLFENLNAGVVPGAVETFAPDALFIESFERDVWPLLAPDVAEAARSARLAVREAAASAGCPPTGRSLAGLGRAVGPLDDPERPLDRAASRIVGDALRRYLVEGGVDPAKLPTLHPSAWATRIARADRDSLDLDVTDPSGAMTVTLRVSGLTGSQALVGRSVRVDSGLLDLETGSPGTGTHLRGSLSCEGRVVAWRLAPFPLAVMEVDLVPIAAEPGLDVGLAVSGTSDGTRWSAESRGRALAGLAGMSARGAIAELLGRIPPPPGDGDRVAAIVLRRGGPAGNSTFFLLGPVGNSSRPAPGYDDAERLLRALDDPDPGPDPGPDPDPDPSATILRRGWARANWTISGVVETAAGGPTSLTWAGTGVPGVDTGPRGPSAWSPAGPAWSAPASPGAGMLRGTIAWPESFALEIDTIG